MKKPDRTEQERKSDCATLEDEEEEITFRIPSALAATPLNDGHQK